MNVLKIPNGNLVVKSAEKINTRLFKGLKPPLGGLGVLLHISEFGIFVEFRGVKKDERIY
jgi:hypothetical protein